MHTVAGTIVAAYDCAEAPAARSSSLRCVNSATLAASWLKTFTTFWPETISST